MADATDGSGGKATGPEIRLRCRCGKVCGCAAGVTPRSVNRAICYCEDCQAFAHHLKRSDLLDARGGTDIVQLPPAAITILQGQDHIAGVRLAPKGLFRWYAMCCNSPLGNMVSPSIPFVGIVTAAFDLADATPDQIFGKPIGAIKGEFAIGEAPAGSRGIRLPILIRSVTKVVSWRLAGRAWPHPFFDRTSGEPIFPVTTLAPDGRNALRPLCGPKPKRACPRNSTGQAT
jgi:hypothetical protein